MVSTSVIAAVARAALEAFEQNPERTAATGLTAVAAPPVSTSLAPLVNSAVFVAQNRDEIRGIETTEEAARFYVEEGIKDEALPVIMAALGVKNVSELVQVLADRVDQELEDEGVIE